MSSLARRSLANVCGEPELPVRVGDLIRTGGNSHPHFRVIALAEDRAWVRDTQHGTDHIVPLSRCRRI